MKMKSLTLALSTACASVLISLPAMADDINSNAVPPAAIQPAIAQPTIAANNNANDTQQPMSSPNAPNADQNMGSVNSVPGDTGNDNSGVSSNPANPDVNTPTAGGEGASPDTATGDDDY